jgi:hypothetical protein
MLTAIRMLNRRALTNAQFQGWHLLAGACLYLILNFILTPPQLGQGRFYFNLYIGLGGAAIGVVKCCRRRAIR